MATTATTSSSQSTAMNPVVKWGIIGLLVIAIAIAIYAAIAKTTVKTTGTVPNPQYNPNLPQGGNNQPYISNKTISDVVDTGWNWLKKTFGGSNTTPTCTGPIAGDPFDACANPLNLDGTPKDPTLVYDPSTCCYI